tara:strand:- start:373 stop:1059 length:687 start_codon:yes stop_codon:yes gene_type:complete
MDKIQKVKSITLWIFFIPLIAINTCLIIVIHFQEWLAVGDGIGPTIPYFDGGTSISRTARIFPTYFIFKPAMFLTSYLLIKYWLFNKEIISFFDSNHKHIKKIVFFGIASAIFLTLHSIFLGIKFDNDFYKLFRRIVMLCFIIFEIVAQTYLVVSIYSIKNKLINLINTKVLLLKLILVSVLIIVAICSIPIISQDGNKVFKHALEWDFFVGVITFYLLTFFMWKKNN